MSSSPAALQPPSRPNLSAEAKTGWLPIGRLAWIGLFLLTFYLFYTALPWRFSMSYQQATGIMGAPVTTSGMITPSIYATALTIMDVIVMAGFLVVSLLLFLRKSGSWMGLFVAFAVLMFGAVTSPTINGPVMAAPNQHILLAALTSLGLFTFLVFLYIFPDGQFVPPWTKWLTVGYGLWALAIWAFGFTPLANTIGSPFFQFASSLVWFGTGVYARVRRRTCKGDAVELQQTKWITYGLLVAFIGYFATYGLALALGSSGGAPNLFLTLVVLGIGSASVLMVPVSIGVSTFRYRLWDIDPLIHRTMIYALLVALLGVGYFVCVIVLQALFRRFTGQTSDVAIVISTILIASLVQPMSNQMRDMVDRRFYRERINFKRAFEVFSHEVRTILELPELMRALVNWINRMWHISYSGVLLYNPDGSFEVSSDRRMTPDEVAMIGLDEDMVERLQSGVTIARPKHKLFPLLVPLLAPRAGKRELIGVLMLGPRLSGQSYNRDDQMLLHVLADQAGTAIFVAQLIHEKQSEAQRREDAEKQLETYRNSPAGRAEAFAQKLIAEPTHALTELHTLAQHAGQDMDAANLLSNLPKAINTPDCVGIEGIAEGYNYLFSSQYAIELLPLGLRKLIAQLEDPTTEHFEYAAEALTIYQLCQRALEASSIAQITALIAEVEECKYSNSSKWAKGIPLKQGFFLDDLIGAIGEFTEVIEMLHACERVDTTQDRITYLVSAVERLSRIDRMARTDLGSADRSLVRHTAETWLAVVTSAISELQTRAQIVCKLLTRHTWQDDVVSLALKVRNEGQGTALNVRVSLAPAPEYSVVDEAVRVERLTPDGEAQIEIRVRPRLAQGVDQFRARFIIQYADPRGPDQVENFADVVYLLSTVSEFKFIPNPYVVGTPLQTGSPLFFGRQDVVSFIQENLAAAHRNNMVLIGQRRTGKTSLLKQLPARLGEGYFPVYIDGQTLGLDPGLPNFFLNLAIEISFALEDRGFTIDQPELADFADSPAATFERVFLPKVRELIGDRHLLILFDEFEELESAVQRGNLDASVFGFLRHLIQHGDKVSVIFCGTHRMEELASDYWSVLFNISLYKDVGFLEHAEALRLIQEPVAAYGMRYDDLALDKMWRVTAGHPYFLQLLCHSLVNRHNRLKRGYITVTDVNAALEEILASGEAHFVYLWTESTAQERLALTALSRMISLSGSATPIQLVDYLEDRGVNVERYKISEALHHLALRDILQAASDADNSMGDLYRWRLGLLGLWAEKYKSLSRVVDEVRA